MSKADEQIRAQFVTEIEEYKANLQPILLYTNLTRTPLSQALNSVLGSIKDDYTPVPFDFKIGDHFLREKLSDVIQQYHINKELVLRIEYFPAFIPPTPSQEMPFDDWISCIKLEENYIYISLYNGQVFRLNKDMTVDRVYYCLLEENNKFAGDSLDSFYVSNPNGTNTFIPKDESLYDTTAIKTLILLNDHIVTADVNGKISVFEKESCLQANRFSFSMNTTPVHALASNPAFSTQFLGANADGEIHLQSIDQKVPSQVCLEKTAIQSIDWTSENEFITFSLGGTIKVWQFRNLENTSEEDGDTPNRISADIGILCGAINGKLAVTGHPDRTARVYRIKEQTNQYLVNKFDDHHNWVSCVAWYNDNVFVTGGYDGKVKMWNIGTVVPLCTISEKDQKVMAVATEPGAIYFGGTNKILERYIQK